MLFKYYCNKSCSSPGKIEFSEKQLPIIILLLNKFDILNGVVHRILNPHPVFWGELESNKRNKIHVHI